MLESITGRFEKIFNKLGKKNRLNVNNVREGIREIKLALLEADVNYKVVKDFIQEVEEEALGEQVIKSVSPTQQFVKVVHDKLVEMMGEHSGELELKKQGISVILMVGLQGSGKTTSSAKLAHHLRDKQRCLLVGADTYRPAAQDQLRILAEQNDIGYFGGEKGDNPVSICKKAMKYAKENDYHCVVIDSAGRLEIDEALMDELSAIKKACKPDEILFVSDSMAGQSIVNVVTGFDSQLSISGVILTKFDSDTRGGAALSITKTTGKNIKFVGVGEKIENLERFHPDRIAGRILGRGDIISFVEKAQESIDLKEAEKLEEKLLQNKFDLNDFLSQIQQVKKMGSLNSLVDMLPGARQVKKEDIEESHLFRTEAIILSMTPKERMNHRIIGTARRQRIAKGSGTKVTDVNRVLKQFDEMQKMLKKFKRNPSALQGMMGQFQGMEV